MKQERIRKTAATLSRICLLVVSILTLSTMSAFANTDRPLSQSEVKQLTSSISQLMQSEYIFPEQAKKMAQLLTNKTEKGKYNQFKQPKALSEQLTEDLRSINQDLHIRVSFNPERIAEIKASESSSQAQQISESELKSMQRANYGFKEVKLLEGNVGYINLTGFYDPKYAGETAVAAMNFVANVDAIIFDLRENGGGSGGMYQLLASYLFDADPVQINSIYWRAENSHVQTWTLPHVPGKRRPDVDVYILTSSRTFSAAEVFSYGLKHLERATLIGETTGGGAHPGGYSIASDRFMVWLPRGRAINPITKTNWEGKGVFPHIKVPKEEAFNTAYMKALEKLIMKKPDEKLFYQWQLDIISAQNTVIEIPNETLQAYSGLYGEEREISVANGELFYNKKGQNKSKLQALSQNIFMFPGINYVRIKVLKEDDKVVAIQIMYDDGSSYKYNRNTSAP